jgi:hypothetical protein
MVEIISLILIIIENSIPLSLTHGIVASAYITYLTSKREMKSIFLSFFVMLLISLQGYSIFGNIIFIIIYSVVFHVIFFFLEFRKGNMPIIAVIQSAIWFLFQGKGLSLKNFIITYSVYLVLDIGYVILKRKYSYIIRGVTK